MPTESININYEMLEKLINLTFISGFIYGQSDASSYYEECLNPFFYHGIEPTKKDLPELLDIIQIHQNEDKKEFFYLMRDLLLETIFKDFDF